MKKWNAPEVAELNIVETANGFFNIDWETPFNIIGNDKADQKPATPDTDDTDTIS